MFRNDVTFGDKKDVVTVTFRNDVTFDEKKGCRHGGHQLVGLVNIVSG